MAGEEGNRCDALWRVLLVAPLALLTLLFSLLADLAYAAVDPRIRYD